MPNRMSSDDLFGGGKSPPKKQMTTNEIFGETEIEGTPTQEKGMGYLESGLHGAGQALTFGYADEGMAAGKALYDKLIKGEDFSDSYGKRLEVERAELERARKNPKSYMSGALAGGAATSFIPGIGWANIGKGASLASNVGKAALAGGLAGSGESKGNLLENQGQLAKDIAIGAGVGGAFQGILGKGSEALKKLPMFAKQKAAERAVKATTGQNIKAIRKMGGTTHASAGDIEKFAQGVRKVGDDIIEEVTPAGKPLLGPFDSVEDLAPKMAEARKYYGGKLGEVGKAVDMFYPKGAVKSSNISDKLRKFAAEIPPIDQGKNLKARIYKIAEEFDEAGDLTFEKAKLFKNQFKYNADDADLLVSNKDVTNKIRSIIGKEMDDTAESLQKNLSKIKSSGPVTVTESGGIPPKTVSGGVDTFEVSPENFDRVQYIRDLLGQYGKYKGKYGSFKQAADAATDRAQKNLSNRFVSPSDYGVAGATGIGSAAATGNPSMLLIGAAGAAANKLLRERGSSLAAVTLKKIADMAENPLFSNKYSRVLLNASDDGPAAMLGVHSVLMNSDPEYKSFFKEKY